MTKPPLPIDETARLMGLHSLRILDTAPEERYDRITRMAQRMFGVSTCLVSLVDSDRQWFKSRQGLDACETDRAISFCGHTILDEEILAVRDARLDPRFADNPLVLNEPFIRFYAGCPIHSPSGHRVGTLCLIDREPREFSPEDELILRDFAAMVEDELRVSSQATVDDLTQIANRRGFNMVAEHILSLCRRTAIGAELVVFDLDGFKAVNDSQGHAIGDLLLQHFSKLLIKCFRTADVVARLGGDEFVVLMTASTDSSGLALNRLALLADETEFSFDRYLNWSVGTTRFDPAIHKTIEDLLAAADAKMYEDKQARKTKEASSI